MPPSLRSAVELRLSKIRGRFLENLIRALQLANFALPVFQSLALVGRQAAALPGVALGLPHPPPQRLRRASQLASDGRDRSPLRRVLRAVLSDHPDRALSDLGGISTRSCHRLHPLNEWALRQTRYDSLRKGYVAWG